MLQTIVTIQNIERQWFKILPTINSIITNMIKVVPLRMFLFKCPVSWYCFWPAHRRGRCTVTIFYITITNWVQKNASSNTYFFFLSNITCTDHWHWSNNPRRKIIITKACLNNTIHSCAWYGTTNNNFITIIIMFIRMMGSISVVGEVIRPPNYWILYWDITILNRIWEKEITVRASSFLLGFFFVSSFCPSVKINFWIIKNFIKNSKLNLIRIDNHQIHIVK